jgi:hypothetical protein
MYLKKLFNWYSQHDGQFRILAMQWKHHFPDCRLGLGGVYWTSGTEPLRFFVGSHERSGIPAKVGNISSVSVSQSECRNHVKENSFTGMPGCVLLSAVIFKIYYKFTNKNFVCSYSRIIFLIF